MLCSLILTLLVAAFASSPTLSMTTGFGRKHRDLFISAGEDSWLSQSDLKEAICILRVTAELLAKEEDVHHMLYLAHEIKGALDNGTMGSIIDGYKDHDTVLKFDDQLGSNYRMPTLDLRMNWATSDQRTLASGLLRRITKMSRELNAGYVVGNSTSNDTSMAAGHLTSFSILPLNLAQTDLEYIESQSFWRIFKRTMTSEVPKDLSSVINAVDVECFAELGDYDQTCSEEAGRTVCRFNEDKKPTLEQILSSLESTANKIDSLSGAQQQEQHSAPPVQHKVIILAVGNHARLKEALKSTATLHPGLANETIWMHPDAFSFGEMLRQEGDLETLEFMEKLGFSTLLTFPTQNFSDAELKKFRYVLKSMSCAPTSTQRALALVKTLKIILKEQPGLPETVEAWSVFVTGFRNRSAVQVIQNSPWMVDEAWTANGAGSRPSDHPAVVRNDVVSRHQLIEEFAATATKCDHIGPISIKTMDPFSLDTVKRIYDSPDFFPQTAIIPRNHGFAISVKCQHSSQTGADLSCSGIDEGLTSCIQAASKKREINATSFSNSPNDENK